LKVAVVGGGFYGMWLSKEIIDRGINVTLYEKNDNLFEGASLLNQARIHNGYHYPRSISTFASSRKNYQTFIDEFTECIDDDITSLYLLSVKSKVSQIKFEKICKILNVPLDEVPTELSRYTDSMVIKKAWAVDEKFYNAKKIKETLLSRMNHKLLQIRNKTKVTQVVEFRKKVKVESVTNMEKESELFDGVIVTTYGQLEMLDSGTRNSLRLKYQLCELLNVEVPPEIKRVAMTVIDGPFWSLTPWPTLGNHLLTHVRYTPTATFSSMDELVQFSKVRRRESNFELVKHDMKKYFPESQEIKHIESRFSIKCLIQKDAQNDGRPIAVSLNSKGNILISIGGKIDNIYDVVPELNDFLMKIGSKY
jgi:hypothetical protein